MRVSPRAWLPLAASTFTSFLLGAQSASCALVDEVQMALDSYLEQRSEIEGNSGASVFIGLGRSGPNISVHSGTTTKQGAEPVTQTSLYQIGSNTKRLHRGAHPCARGAGQAEHKRHGW